MMNLERDLQDSIGRYLELELATNDPSDGSMDMVAGRLEGWQRAGLGVVTWLTIRTVDTLPPIHVNLAHVATIRFGARDA